MTFSQIVKLKASRLKNTVCLNAAQPHKLNNTTPSKDTSQVKADHRRHAAAPEPVCVPMSHREATTVQRREQVQAHTQCLLVKFS